MTVILLAERSMAYQHNHIDRLFNGLGKSLLGFLTDQRISMRLGEAIFSTRETILPNHITLILNESDGTSIIMYRPKSGGSS